jgi:hypothetical protein
MPASTWTAPCVACAAASAHATAAAFRAVRPGALMSPRHISTADTSSERATSVAKYISAHRCLTAWKDPIFTPNCSRVFAYSTAVCTHQSAMPRFSAASSNRATCRAERRAASASPASWRPVTRFNSMRACGRPRSRVCSGVRVVAAASTANTASPAPVRAATRSRSALAPSTTSTTPVSTSASAVTVSGRPSSGAARTAAVPPPATADSSSASPAAASTVVAIAVERNGTAAHARPVCSATTARAPRSAPAPPNSSGTARPAAPSCVASCFQAVSWRMSGGWTTAFRSSRDAERSRSRATSLASAVSSGVGQPIVIFLTAARGWSRWRRRRPRTWSAGRSGRRCAPARAAASS